MSGPKSSGASSSDMAPKVQDTAQKRISRSAVGTATSSKDSTSSAKSLKGPVSAEGVTPTMSPLASIEPKTQPLDGFMFGDDVHQAPDAAGVNTMGVEDQESPPPLRRPGYTRGSSISSTAADSEMTRLGPLVGMAAETLQGFAEDAPAYEPFVIDPLLSLVEAATAAVGNAPPPMPSEAVPSSPLLPQRASSMPTGIRHRPQVEMVERTIDVPEILVEERIE